MDIAVYGGSFNPPHLGHVSAVRSVLELLSPDKLLVIPTSIPPHKEVEEGSPSPEERLELCRLAFADLPGLEVSDMELQREGKSYTAYTVEELKELYPDAGLSLVIGSDMFLSFCQWHRYQYLLENCRLVVLSREDDDMQQLENFRSGLERDYSARVEILGHEPLPMSSTDIRARLRLGLAEDMLPESVYSRIISKRLYDAKPELSWLRAQVEPMLSSKRLAHCAGCESEAVMLAMHWGEDPESAAEAGILHDITKKLSMDEQLILCEKYGIILSAAEKEHPRIVHAITGAELARALFGISDEVHGAIRWHTTGKPDMTRLEKIVYLADYIEPTRDFEGVEKLRELAYEDLDEAMELGLRMSLEDIHSRGEEPLEDTVEAYHWYSREN